MFCSENIPDAEQNLWVYANQTDVDWPANAAESSGRSALRPA